MRIDSVYQIDTYLFVRSGIKEPVLTKRGLLVPPEMATVAKETLRDWDDKLQGAIEVLKAIDEGQLRWRSGSE